MATGGGEEIWAVDKGVVGITGRTEGAVGVGGTVEVGKGVTGGAAAAAAGGVTSTRGEPVWENGVGDVGEIEGAGWEVFLRAVTTSDTGKSDSRLGVAGATGGGGAPEPIGIGGKPGAVGSFGMIIFILRF